jgi:Ca2+ transporting ATPase
MENAYTKTPAEALQHFQVTENKGLSAQQVATLREKHGKNGMLDSRNVHEAHNG